MSDLFISVYSILTDLNNGYEREFSSLPYRRIVVFLREGPRKVSWNVKIGKREVAREQVENMKSQTRDVAAVVNFNLISRPRSSVMKRVNLVINQAHLARAV